MFGSSVGPGATVAVFVIVPVADEATSTGRLIVAVETPSAIEAAWVHVTALARFEQLQPVPVGVDANVSPDGSVSVTVIGPAEVAGPLLVTTIEYVPLWPAVKLPLWLLVIDKSAPVTTVAVSVAVLFEVTGSAVAPGTTLAVLVIVPVWSAPTVTTRLIWAIVAFAATLEGFVQVTVALDEPEPSLQVQSVPDAETKLSPDGSVSMTVIGPAEVAGPALATVRA
jgi:hypothetical protein